MGPRPDGRGRTQARGLRSSTRASVNGAAAGWQRKDVVGDVGRQAQAERQWGRGRMAAEGGHWGRRRPC